MDRKPAAALLAVLALPLAACGPEKVESPRPLPPPVSLGQPTSHHEHSEKGPVPAPGPAPRTVETPAMPRPKGFSKEQFAAPGGWTPEKPASAMRLLQFRLPRADGDARDGEVAVFGSAMGDVKANIERWRGMFREVAQGKDAVEEIPAGGGTVTLLDITGMYVSSMAGAPPAGAGEAVETRMIAAVVEVPAGTCYVKTTGPPATMAKWSKSIRDFILAAAGK